MSITLTHESHAPSVIGPRYTAESLPPHWQPQRPALVVEIVPGSGRWTRNRRHLLALVMTQERAQ